MRRTGLLEARHLAFMDWDSIYFDLARFKSERGWHNLNLPRDRVRGLLKTSDWYTLYIPPEELSFRSFRQVRRWEEIAAALLKKYVDGFYNYKRDVWERQQLEFRDLFPGDLKFTEGYDVLSDSVLGKIGFGSLR